MKIWKGTEKSDEKIIAYSDSIIYICNPKISEVENVIQNLKMNIIPTDKFTSVPLSYLREIHLEEGKKYIEILFGGDSKEQLNINDLEIRNEIFEYFKSNISKSVYMSDTYSKLRAGKKPLIAMTVLLSICLWTFYISNGIEQGDEYKVIGNQRSVASIVLMIASLGSTNILLIFGIFFGIALTSFIIKTKNPKIVQKIIMVR